MDLDLHGRSVLVTGATGGIGGALARGFAGEGARVAVAYHSRRAEAEELAAELGADGGYAAAVPYSLDDPGSPAVAVAAVEELWGGLDVLVLNAVRRGARRPPSAPVESVPADEWEPVVTANLTPAIRTAQAALPGMRRRGWGRIALLSSHVATDGKSGQEFYGAAKAGLHGFARSLAWDAGRDGVLVNVVSPGLTLTDDVLSKLPPPVRSHEVDETPTGRLSSPQDVARTVVFLCSGANGNITGENVTVAGGR